MSCANPKLKPAYVIGYEGHRVTEDDLPPRGNRHRRHRNSHQKALVIAAVEGGLLTQHDAICRYALSMEEYLT